MEGLAPLAAGLARIEAGYDRSSVAAVLVDVSTGRQELLVRIDPVTGHLTASLCGDAPEAVGHGPVGLTKLSPHTTVAATTVVMNGYDPDTDQCSQLETAISLAWTINDFDPNSVDVAGTALLIDLDDDSLVPFRALRSHRFNRFHLAAGTSLPTHAGLASHFLPAIASPDQSQLVAS